MSTVAGKRGDTLLEVVFAFTMFSLVTLITVSAMNGGISSAEASLELTLARTEIDAQSDTLRFIQSAFANDRSYGNLWRKIIERKADPNSVPDLSVSSCSSLYGDYATLDAKTIYDTGLKAFVVNPRHIGNSTDENSSNWYGHTLITADNRTSDKISFTTSSLNPRLIYTKGQLNDDGDTITTDDVIQEDELYTEVARVEGIYDFVVADQNHPDKSYFYDFHIYTCWYAPGAERPTTIGTVTRLYNPEFNR